MAMAPQQSAHHQLRIIQESMTAREVTYAEARVNGTPPTAAARVAGIDYPETKAKKLEADQRVKTCIQMLVQQQMVAANITRDDVINGLMESMHLATTASELIKAWSEIAKIIGAHEPKKIDVTKKQDPQQLQRMSDTELMEQAGDVVDGEYQPLDFDEEEGNAE